MIDYFGIPKTSLPELMDLYTPDTCLIMDEVLDNRKSYNLVYQHMLDFLKWGFENDEIRLKPIHFKFHLEDKEIETLPLTNFLSHLILWNAFMDMDRSELLDKSYLFDFHDFQIGDIATKYIDKLILPHHEGDFHTKNKVVGDIWYAITAIAAAFGPLMGMSISTYDIIQAEKACPEISELIHSPIDSTMQPVEIEEELSRRTKRLMQLFTQVDCDLKPLILSGKNLNENQVKEIFIKIGFKSDINGKTIPHFMNENIFITGLTKPSTLYIGATSGRKSLILTKQAMSEPGAFSKRANLLSTSASILREDYEQCDSTELVEYEIRNETYLELLDLRYYIDKEDGNKMKLVNGSKDKHLIGKKVSFLSPCTCNSQEGICKYCYGELFEINKGLFSVGSYAATKSSEPIGQSVLSTKHTQTTSSDIITFNKDFEETCELSSTEITLKETFDSDSVYGIVLGDLFVEESDDDEAYYVKTFDFVDIYNKSVYHIEEENETSLYLSNELLSILKKMKDKTKAIPLDAFDDDSVLFMVDIKSKETTQAIKVIEKVLNRKDRGVETVSGICQLMADTFIGLGIKYNLVHFECIIRGIIRKKSDILEFPDWGPDGDHDDYQIIQINSGLIHNPSPLVSLTYGYVRKQLISPELYRKKGTSHLDALFVRDLKTYID